MPKDNRASSISSAFSPASISSSAANMYGKSARFTKNPGLFWTLTGSLPIFRASWVRRTISVSSFTGRWTISINGRTVAGLKKCRPNNRDGIDIDWLISSKSRAELLVAKRQSLRLLFSRPLQMDCFNAIFSETASITRSILDAVLSVTPQWHFANASCAAFCVNLR